VQEAKAGQRPEERRRILRKMIEAIRKMDAIVALKNLN